MCFAVLLSPLTSAALVFPVFLLFRFPSSSLPPLPIAKMLNDPAATYLGAPIRINDRVIGSFCGFFSGLPDGEPRPEDRALMQRKADRAAKLLQKKCAV